MAWLDGRADRQTLEQLGYDVVDDGLGRVIVDSGSNRFFTGTGGDPGRDPNPAD